MLGTILRLAMLAGTGAGMAAGFRNAMVKLVALFAAALVVSLIIAAAIAAFGFAIYVALAPQVGTAWAAAAAGLLLIVIAALLTLACRTYYLRRSRPVASGAAGLGGPLGAAALGASMGGASMGAGPSFDLKGALGRNALTVLLTAFIAGMVMTNRR
jgi:hypothetical protein